ncbi:MAG TPA: hypothetical protein VG840_10305 [Casimicrobiaceae bacterium]|nr:hypothetical protein [Casimicrobiaceae bacterium]
MTKAAAATMTARPAMAKKVRRVADIELGLAAAGRIPGANGVKSVEFMPHAVRDASATHLETDWSG